MFKKPISIVVLTMFLINNTVYGLSPVVTSSQWGEVMSTRVDMFETAMKRFADKRIGPGKIEEAIEALGTPANQLMKGEVPQLSDMKPIPITHPRVREAAAANPIIWQTDLIEALQEFAKTQARIPEGKLIVEKGYFEFDEEKGDVPIARLEKVGDQCKLIVHHRFVDMWNHIRELDQWFEVDLPDAEGVIQKRAVSAAWGLFYRLAKHEMADLTDKELLEKGGGHFIYAQELTDTLIRLDDNMANKIGGRYAEINDAIWLWFLTSYCFRDTTRYNNDILKERMEWIFNSDEARDLKLPEEFSALMQDEEKREIAINRALLLNNEFFMGGIDVPEFERDEVLEEAYALRKDDIKALLYATGYRDAGGILYNELVKWLEAGNDAFLQAVDDDKWTIFEDKYIAKMKAAVTDLLANIEEVEIIQNALERLTEYLHVNAGKVVASAIKEMDHLISVRLEELSDNGDDDGQTPVAPPQVTIETEKKLPPVEDPPSPVDITITQLEKAYKAFQNADKRTKKKVYDLVAPEAPHGGGYLVAAGLEMALADLHHRRFSKAYMERLEKLGMFSKDFLRYVSRFHFQGNIEAVQEGRVLSPGMPIMRIEATEVELALMEDQIKNRLGISIDIATKTSRIAESAKGTFVGEEDLQRLKQKYGMSREDVKKIRAIMEFGFRRAQGEAASLASRAAIIGGAVGTSNMQAAMRHYLSAMGTMAHLFIMLFPPEAEIDAFRLYVKCFPGWSTLLIDTYDTINGAHKAAIVAKEMEERGEQLIGVRLDSGNILELSQQVRKILDNAGLKHRVKIFASDDLDEYKINELVSQGACIDGFGVGTHLITGGKQASMGLDFVESNESRYWKSVSKGLLGRFLRTKKDRMAYAEYNENVTELLIPYWKNGRRVARVEKPWKAHERAGRELQTLGLENKKLDDAAEIPIEYQDNYLSINPETDALVVIDEMETFMEMGGLAVTEGGAVVPVTQRLKERFPKENRFFARDQHPWGHICFASSFVGFPPMTQLTEELISTWTEDDNPIAPHALFTLDDVKEYVSLLGSDNPQTLWPDHGFQRTVNRQYFEHMVKDVDDLWVDLMDGGYIDSHNRIKDDRTIELDETKYAKPVIAQIDGIFRNINKYSDESDIHPDFIDDEFEFIQDKGMDPTTDSYSAFFDNRGNPTGLADKLREKGFKRVFVVGLALDYCAGWSAIDAHKEGFEVIVVENATRSVGFPGDQLGKIKAEFESRDIKLVPDNETVIDANMNVDVYPAAELKTAIPHPPAVREELDTALEEDMYHLTMGQPIYQSGLYEKEATFNYFYRTPPYGKDFIITSGLKFFIDKLRKFRFTPEVIAHLRSLHQFNDEYIDYLSTFEFKGEIMALPDGSVAYPHEPIMRIRGTLMETMIIETFILNKRNFANLIATNASRIRDEKGEDAYLIEDGLPVAQGMSHIQAAYAAYQGGTDATTNLDAHLMFGIPLATSETKGVRLGAELVTGGEVTSLGGVYKLAKFDGHDRLKVSDNKAKTSRPGDQVIVVIKDEGGNVVKRFTARDGEDVALNPGEYTEYPLVTIVENGNIVYDVPDIEEGKNRAIEQKQAYQAVPESGMSDGLTARQQELVTKASGQNKYTGKESLRVAQAQINTIVGDMPGNVKKIEDYIEQCREQDVDLIVFPELTVTGYSPQDLVDKDGFIGENLEAVHSLIDKTEGIAIVVGFVNVGEDGRLYNAAAIIADGELKGVYHKNKLPNEGIFDEKRIFAADTNPEVYDINGISVAFNICHDMWIAEDNIYEKQAERGAKVLINLSASPYHIGKMDERKDLIRGIVDQTSTYFVYTNLVGGQDGIVSDGGSMVFNPDGKIIAQGEMFKEDLIITDLDMRFFEGHRRAFDTIPVRKADPEKTRKPVQGRPEWKVDRLQSIYDALVLGLRDYVQKNGFKKVVLGVSGGIDSALVAKLAVDALGKENVVGISMPTHFNQDETKSDARKLCENLGIQFMENPIEEMFEHTLEVLRRDSEFAKLEEDVTEENIQARLRMLMLMAYSNKMGWMVLATGNKTESSVGFATLYGDMSGGFSPLIDVDKDLVFELSEFVNSKGEEIIPKTIITRPPTPELRKEKPLDSDKLPPYDILCDILRRLNEEDKTFVDISQDHDDTMIADVIRMVYMNEYKRQQGALGVKITKKALRGDRRIPITNKYRDTQKSLIEIVDEYIARTAMKKGPGNRESQKVTPAEVENIGKTVNLFHENKIEIIMPQIFQNTLTKQTNEAIKDIIRAQRRETERDADIIDISGYSSEQHLMTLLRQEKPGVKRIVLTEGDMGKKISTLLGSDTGLYSLFKNIKLLQMELPKNYYTEDGMNFSEKTVHQARIITIAILARLLENGGREETIIRGLLSDLLKGRIEGATMSDFLDQLGASDESVTEQQIQDRVDYFLEKIVSLVSLLERELRIMKTFWTFA